MRANGVPAYGRDPQFPRRMAIALACAVAVHEIAAGFVHSGSRPQAEARTVAEVVTVSTLPPTATPRPTPPPPKPTPPPQHPTPQPIVTFAPVPSVARAGARAPAPVAHRMGGRAATRVVRVTQPRPSQVQAQPRAIALNDASGVANGGAGTGAGAGTGDGGANGTAGNGTGDSGTGAGGGVAPCGVVILVPVPPLQLNHDGSRTVAIKLEVHLSDGSISEDDLGWKFLYRRESDDPFSKAGETAGTPVLLQLPPAGYDLEGRQKPATVFAVQHTDRGGFTDLADCPNS